MIGLLKHWSVPCLFGLAWKRFGHALADVVGREAKLELQKEDAQGRGKVAEKKQRRIFFKP
jgi:hypothetical protein